MQKNIRCMCNEILLFHFPNSKKVKIKPLGGGLVNLVYLVEVDEDKYILKIKNVLDKSCEQAIANEYFIQKASSKIKNAMPNIVYADTTGFRFGYKYVIYEYVDGFTIEKCNEKIFYLAGIALANIHCLEIQRVGRIQKSKLVRSEEDVLTYYNQYFVETMDSLSRIEPDISKLVNEYVNNNFSMEYYNKQSLVVLHNDIHPRNIIYNSGSIVFIDWDCAKYGHKEVDFVKFKHLSQKVTTSTCIKSFFEGYKSIQGDVFTPNFRCHEIVWLSKMIVFDYYNKKKDYNYFPSRPYYVKTISNLIERK